MYPILFYDCFIHLLTVVDTSGDDTSSGNPWHEFYTDNTVRFIFLGVLTGLLTLLNLKGLDVVGNVSLVICALSLLPFVVFCIVGAPHVQTERWFQGNLLYDHFMTFFYSSLYYRSYYLLKSTI